MKKCVIKAVNKRKKARGERECMERESVTRSRKKFYYREFSGLVIEN